ncbi:MAG: lipoyl synthase [Ignavibacteria bacterium]|nr:lipoyl synthase [Ignavibacteria bacterium]
MINKHQQQHRDKTEKTREELGKRPDWLKIKVPIGKSFSEVNNIIHKSKLNTVCEEARCPNQAECWNNRTATFMILGDTCTRSCGFCKVKVGIPNELDLDEPRRVTEAVLELGLKHVVITSVNRDELNDGGASVFAETIRLIREKAPLCSIETLIPDFKGEKHAFEILMKNPPDILNHNLETIERLYHAVRPQAKYQRSLELIKWFSGKGLKTKSGIMVGIGEKPSEVIELMHDLIKHKCDILTIGQYLRPSLIHLPVDRYVPLEEFQMYKKAGLEMGFKIIESGPLVRSSYHADKHI